MGAQNMQWADAGAWTGKVSPVMLKVCGLDRIELGHGERREHFGETDRTVDLKTEAAVRHGFVPLVCVGETLAERESGRADAALTAQTKGASRLLDAQQRAALTHDTYSAERAALSNNAHIITMGARVIGPELAKAIADAFLAQNFDEAGRSAPNVKAINEVEAKYAKA